MLKASILTVLEGMPESDVIGVVIELSLRLVPLAADLKNEIRGVNDLLLLLGSCSGLQRGRC